MIQSTYTGPVPPSKNDDSNKNKDKKLDSFHIRIIKLLIGDYCRFYKNELKELIKNMDEFNINTISIQKLSDSFYYCKVDDETIKFYKNKNKER